MSTDLQELIERYPRLMRGKPPTIPGYVDAGWHPIVMRLMRRIDVLLDEELAANFQVAQIKEKFGGLRFYFDLDGRSDINIDVIGVARLLVPGEDEDEDGAAPRPSEIDTINGYIREAEEEAWRTCEQCGAAGHPNKGRGWIRTLCDRHHAERWDRS